MKKTTLTRLTAMAMAATLVFGSSLTAFATGGEGGEGGGSETTQTQTSAPATSGYSEGTGTPEGHVERKVTLVTLPVIPSGSTPFAYTMDPERLITATSHEKYGTTVEFPTTGDTGVYFNNGKKGGEGDDKDNIVYKNESTSLKVVNNSSHSVNVTVKAEVVDAATTDIPLVAKSAISTAQNASLYLGLQVGTASESNAAVAIAKDTAASKTFTIEGTPGNFKVAAKSDKSGYEYRVKTVAEVNADKAEGAEDITELKWAEESFKLEGSVTSGKNITSTTTAPKVKVTWSWVDPSANAAPSAAATQAVLESGKAAVVSVDLGLGDLAATGVSSVVNKGLGNDWLSAGAVSYADGKLTFVKPSDVDFMIASENGNHRVFTVTFNDTAETKVEITLSEKQ